SMLSQTMDSIRGVLPCSSAPSTLTPASSIAFTILASHDRAATRNVISPRPEVSAFESGSDGRTGDGSTAASASGAFIGSGGSAVLILTRGEHAAAISTTATTPARHRMLDIGKPLSPFFREIVAELTL